MRSDTVFCQPFIYSSIFCVTSIHMQAYTHMCLSILYIRFGVAPDQGSISLCSNSCRWSVGLTTSHFSFSNRCWLHTTFHNPLFPPPLLSYLSFYCLFPDKKEDIAVPPAVVLPTPSKRGRKSKQVMGRVAGVGGVLPPGSDALILAHLAAGGQVRVFVFAFTNRFFVRRLI